MSAILNTRPQCTYTSHRSHAGSYAPITYTSTDVYKHREGETKRRIYIYIYRPSCRLPKITDTWTHRFPLFHTNLLTQSIIIKVTTDYSEESHTYIDWVRVMTSNLSRSDAPEVTHNHHAVGELCHALLSSIQHLRVDTV